jgi:Thioredoxin-like proteins and domains
MFIQTEATPNPATMMFFPGKPVLEAGSADFATVEAATNSPLARRLFAVDGVAGVFLSSDFITVTKASATSWDAMKALVLAAIMDHYTSGEPAIEGSIEGVGADGETTEDKVVQQIKELIETRVRPAVAQDGGDIVFRGFENGIVYLHMQGSCSGCPSSMATLKHGVENMLRYYVPEVQEVRPIYG